MDFFLFYSAKQRTTPGPTVRFHCPKCKKQEVEADTFETEEKISVFFIPVSTQRERHVVCRACGADRVTSAQLADLADLDAAEVAGHLRERASFPAQVVAILALLLFWVPVIGLFLAVVGVIGNRRSCRWAFWVSVVAAAATVLLWATVIVKETLIGPGRPAQPKTQPLPPGWTPPPSPTWARTEMPAMPTWNPDDFWKKPETPDPWKRTPPTKKR